jgi:hypothetical protein
LPSLPGNVNAGAFCPSKFAMQTSSGFVTALCLSYGRSFDQT